MVVSTVLVFIGVCIGFILVLTSITFLMESKEKKAKQCGSGGGLFGKHCVLAASVALATGCGVLFISVYMYAKQKRDTIQKARARLIDINAQQSQTVN